MDDKVYQGTRDTQGWVIGVTVNDRPLHNYGTSEGFNWEYSGEGPSSLALSIMCDFFEVAQNVDAGNWDWRSVPSWAYYNRAFLEDVIIPMPQRNFTLTSQEIAEWMAKERPFQENQQYTLALMRG